MIKTTKIGIGNKTFVVGYDNTPVAEGSEVNSNGLKYWQFGYSNKLDSIIYKVAISSPILRGILQSKADYLSGRALVCTDENKELKEFINNCDGRGGKLHNVIKNRTTDYLFFGNKMLELAATNQFLNVFHRDFTKCRCGKKQVTINEDKSEKIENNFGKIILSPSWKYQQPETEWKYLSKYWEQDQQGIYRKIIHTKDYEPTYEHYGIPSWLSGIISAKINGNKNAWINNGLENGFSVDRLIFFEGETGTPEEELNYKNHVKNRLTGVDGEKTNLISTKFSDKGNAPIEVVDLKPNEPPDYSSIHSQSIEELFICVGWRPELLREFSSGLSKAQLIDSYYMVFSQYIKPYQEAELSILKPILEEFGYKTDDLKFINEPPIPEIDNLMTVKQYYNLRGWDIKEIPTGRENEFVGEIGAKTKTV